MASLLNRARMSTSTTGTGTITLDSATTGYASFAEAGAVNATVYSYCIEDGDDFEIGVGTYTSSGTTFSRDTVTLSKIGGTSGTSKIDLSGNASIFITARVSDFDDYTLPATSAVERTIAGRLADFISVKDFDAKGDAVTLSDAAITSGDATLSSATASFTSADIGKYIEVSGAGAAGAVLQSTIASLNSSTSVELSDNASTTVSGETCIYGTDDEPAIAAALSAMISGNRRGSLYFPRGKYLLGDTLTGVFGVTLDGAGVGSNPAAATVLLPFHDNGPVIRIPANYSGVKNMAIDATPARQAAAAGSAETANCGILHYPSVNLACWVEYHKLSILRQPSHGIYFAGTINQTLLSLVEVANNGQHGIYMTDGDEMSGPADVTLPGLLVMIACIGFDNGGHGLLGGDENDAEELNRVVRLTMLNCEWGRNALSAGSRHSSNQVHLIGSEITIIDSCFVGENLSGTPTTNGLWIAGKNIRVGNCRFVACASGAINVAQVTWWPSDVTIDGIVCSDGGSTFDPAITVASGAIVRARTGNYAGMASLLNTIPEVRGERAVITKLTDEIRTATTTETADAVLKFAIPLTKLRVKFRAVILYASPAAADLKIGFTSPASSTIRWSPDNGVIINTSDTLAVQNAVLVSGTTIAVGGSASRRMLMISGEVQTNGTAGDLTLVWAQNTSDAGNTTIYGQSRLEVEY